jgi:hypothetical protein
MGEITCDLETVLGEMAWDHDMQLGEILALVKCWVEIHAPGAIEEYDEGGRPLYYYGHPECVPDKLPINTQKRKKKSKQPGLEAKINAEDADAQTNKD